MGRQALELICSFCELTFDDLSLIVKKGRHAICADCVSVVKEIFIDFERSEIHEGGGICTFCGKSQSRQNKVFKGKKIHICSLCLEDIEDDLKQMEQSGPEGISPKRPASIDSIKSRVRPEIEALRAYSVPNHKCSIKLDGNESPIDLTADIKQRLLDKINSVELNRYPDPQALVLRRKISEKAQVDLEQVVIGNGSDELIEMIIRGFAGRSGKVLVPTPTFSMYKISSVTLGHEVVEVPLTRRFDLDTDRTLGRIESDDPDIIFLATPNNPTGNCFSQDRITEIIGNTGGLVVVDEAYCDFSGVSHMDRLSEYPNLVILQTMSKIGFASLRLGMLFASKEITEIINKIRLPYNINSLSQTAAEFALDNFEYIGHNIEIIKAERARVFGRMKIIPAVEAFNTDANFILFRVENADRVYKQLIERDILIRNFNTPGRLENCMRVTIGTPSENDEFLKALTAILSS